MNRKKFLQVVTTATAATALAAPTVRGSSNLSYEELPERGRNAVDYFRNEVMKVSDVSGATRGIAERITSPLSGFTFETRSGGFTISFDSQSGQSVHLNHSKGKLKARVI